MPQNWREYVYTGLLIATGVLVIAGLVVFASAVSFQGYITAMMLLALAGCSIVGARVADKDAHWKNPHPS